jgi:hypothetical protein
VLGAIGALMVVGMASEAAGQTWSLTGAPGTWERPPSMQPMPFTARGSWVSMPFVTAKQPWNYAQGGNRPIERETPDRLNPNLPGQPVVQPLPHPTPSVANPDGRILFPNTGTEVGAAVGNGAIGQDPAMDPAHRDPPGTIGTIDLPTASTVSVGSGGGISLGTGTGWGWNTSSNVHRDASTGYLTGWNRPLSQYGVYDPRLSTHYKPAEIEQMRARERAEAEAAKLTYMERGLSALAKGNLELAEQLLSEQLRQTPEDVALIRTIGVVELLMKRTDAGVKRIAGAYGADPLLCDSPIDASIYPGGETRLKRAASDVASLATKPGRSDAALVAAAFAQSRGDAVVAGRFLDRAAAGVDPTLIARFKGTLVPPTPPTPEKPAQGDNGLGAEPKKK